MKKRTILSKAVAAVFFVSIVVQGQALFADGPMRRATPQEKAFHLEVMSVLEQAVPPGPEGWHVNRRTTVKPVEWVGEGIEIAPWRRSYTVEYFDREAKSTAGQAMAEAGIEAMKQDQAANPTQSAEARFEKLSQKLVEAFNRGDMTEAGRIRQEMEKIGQELNAAYDKRDRAMESAARQHEAKDVSMKISLVVNSLQEDLNGFTPAGSLDGMPVFRSPGEYAAHTGWQEGVTMVFAGPGWNLLQDGDAVWMSAKTREAAHTETQTLVVRIRAEEGRAQEMLERMDWDALRGLLR